jgi:hypothetical protein
MWAISQKKQENNFFILYFSRKMDVGLSKKEKLIDQFLNLGIMMKIVIGY